jgi:hypothetical protein
LSELGGEIEELPVDEEDNELDDDDDVSINIKLGNNLNVTSIIPPEVVFVHKFFFFFYFSFFIYIIIIIIIYDLLSGHESAESDICWMNINSKSSKFFNEIISKEILIEDIKDGEVENEGRGEEEEEIEKDVEREEEGEEKREVK